MKHTLWSGMDLGSGNVDMMAAAGDRISRQKHSVGVHTSWYIKVSRITNNIFFQRRTPIIVKKLKVPGE